MFQEFLSFTSNTALLQKYPTDQFILRTFNKPNQSLDLPSMFEDCLESISENNNKHLTEQINTQELSPQTTTKEKRKRVRKYTSNNPNNKKGHWNHQQNLKYHFFIELYAYYFIDRERRKTDKIFKSMGSFIQTREAYQCRSHHQKIKKKWGSFLDILVNLRLQNFGTVDQTPLIKQLLNLGYENHRILSEKELKYSQELEIKTLELRLGERDSMDGHKTQENEQIQQIADNTSGCHKRNCVCLIMNQNYEDQLQI